MKTNFLFILLLVTLMPLRIFSQTSELQQSYDSIVSRSFVYLDKNDLENAELFLKKAMEKEPDNPLNVLLLSNLGTIKRRQNDEKDALYYYNAALDRAPKNATILSNRASLFIEMNQPQNAIADFTSILLDNPQDQEALYQRGMIYLQVKNFSAAEADFMKIIDINPQTVSGRIGMISLYKVEKQYDKAYDLYYYLMDKVKDNADLYAGRAELYYLMGKYGRAQADIDKAISIVGENTSNPYYFVIRGRIKKMMYEKEGAKADLKKARDLGYKGDL